MPLAALVAVTLIAALVAGAIAWRYPRAPGATVVSAPSASPVHFTLTYASWLNQVVSSRHLCRKHFLARHPAR